MLSNQTNSSYDYLLKDKQFMSIKSCEEKVEYIVTEVKPLSQFIEDVFRKADLYQLKHRKSLNNSQSFLFEGQNYLEHKQFKLAKDCFTNAILSAPFPEDCVSDDKHELSLCYACRSLAFFQMKRYDSALFDANQSLVLLESMQIIDHKINCILFANGFNRMEELIDECIRRINEKEISRNSTKNNLEQLKTSTTEYIVRTSCGQNTIEKAVEKESETQELTYLWIHSNIEMKTSTEKGRHLVAKKDISNNTLIIREKTSNVVYFGQNVNEFCSFCHKQIGDQNWPCRHCDQVVFCNQNCGRQAMDGIHRYECGKTGLIFELGSNALQVFRIFAKIGFKSLNSITKKRGKDLNFKKYVNQELQRTYIERTDSQKWNQFEFISNLMEHSDKQTESESIDNTFKAIQTTILLHYSKLLNPNFIYDIKSFASFATVVFKHLNRLPNNVFGWFVDKEDNESDTHVANCLCLYSAMINHSCDPNTYWYFENNYIYFKTIRELKEGEEINITYGPDVFTPLIERQIKLKENYYFVCNCNACLRSIFTVRSLKCLDCDGPVIYKPGANLNSCLQCGQHYQNMEEVIEKVNILSENLKKRIKNMAKDIDRERALESVQNTIESLKELVHKSSYDLLKPIRQLIKLCMYFSEIQKAIDLSKHLLPSIDSQTNKSQQIFTDLFDDLFLLTQIYFKYLSDNQIEDKTEWRTAFHVFNITIDLLERVKQRKPTKEREDSNSMLNNRIKQFNQELQELKRKEREVFGLHICSLNVSPLSTHTQEFEFCGEVKELTFNSIISGLLEESSDSVEDCLQSFSTDLSESLENIVSLLFPE